MKSLKYEIVFQYVNSVINYLVFDQCNEQFWELRDILQSTGNFVHAIEISSYSYAVNPCH